MNKSKLSFETINNLISLYKDLKSINEVSEKTGIYSGTIYYHLRKNRIDTTIDRKKSGERIRKYKIDPNYFSEINTRDKAYITGILHSDGCITKNTNQVRIKLTDIDLVEKINSKIYKDRPLYFGEVNTKNKKNALIVISHHQIFNDVQKHGCCFDKTYNLEFPTTIPNEFMGDYFRGFFDGDGCIYINEKLNWKPATISIVATNKWIEGATKWLSFRNIKVANYPDKRHDNRIGRLTLKDISDNKNFFELIYDNIKDQIYLERKFTKYKYWMKLKNTEYDYA